MKAANDLIRLVLAGLVARTVLIGVALGFVCMIILGRLAARDNFHGDFSRIHMWISPETKYYMTIEELMTIVRSRARPDQTLVIIGGNSVLRGVGQLSEHLWSKRLQEQLGDSYCVVNLAFNGSLITDGASVVAEALRSEYPRQIYIANAAPTQAPTVGGSHTYSFVYWGAHAKGLLIDDPERNEAIAGLLRIVSNPAEHPPVHPFLSGLRELQARSWLDGHLYFQDFWNRFTFTKLNTVWAPYLRRRPVGGLQFLAPRSVYKDPEPDALTFPFEVRYQPELLETEMVNVRGNSIHAFAKDASGQWAPVASTWDAFSAGLKGTFPAELRKRTLILLGQTSPFYRQRLTPDEIARDNLSFAKAVELWKAGGFDAIEFGRDFAINDYADRTHLTRLGGDKLAAIVADKVRSMSAGLGYTKTQ